MFDITQITDFGHSQKLALTLTDAQWVTIGKLTAAQAIDAGSVSLDDVLHNQHDGDITVYVSTAFSHFQDLPLDEQGYAPLIIRKDGSVTSIEGNPLQPLGSHVRIL